MKAWDDSFLRIVLAILMVYTPCLVAANPSPRGKEPITVYKQYPSGRAVIPATSHGGGYVGAMSEGPIEVDPNVPQSCPDVNGDKFVNLLDYSTLAANWLETGENLAGDFDESQEVDVNDLTFMTDNWLTDPGCPERIAENLPWLSSFESFQGYTADNLNFLEGTDLNFQMSWRVEEGVAIVSEDVAVRVDTKWSGAAGLPSNLPYQYIIIGNTPEPNSVATVLTKEFDDQGSDHRFVRVHFLPAVDMQIRVMNGPTTIAGVHFDPNAHISAWDDGAWRATGENYASEYNTGWGLFWNNAAYDSAYQNLTFDINYSTHEYDVIWNGSTIYTAQADPNSNTMTHLQIETSTLDWGIINRVSISDFSSGTLEMEVTAPCACNDDLELKGNIPVTGQAWGEDFGLYELYLIPAELDLQDINNWSRFDVHNQVVDSGGTLGHFDAGAVPNGIYYWGMQLYDDFGISESFDVIFKQVYLNDTLIYDGPGQFPVTGDLKVNTFTHTEEPDISVPWPGQFPFELKRIYNNNRRFFPKPIRNGWTHNNQISLFEDASVHMETFQNGPFLAAKFDNHLVAFGLIYVTFPDGRRKMFRHSGGNDIAGFYTPWPDDGSGDVIKRTSIVDDFNFLIKRFLYTYTTRDGVTLSFDSGTINAFYNPVASQGNLFSRVVSPASSMVDRFGNQLNFTWNSDKTAVREVREVGHPANRKIKFFDENDDGFYEEARLIVNNDDNNPLRRVLFDWLPATREHTVTALNAGVDEDGVYPADPNEVKQVTRYEYDAGLNLIAIEPSKDPNDPNSAAKAYNPSIEVDYDAFGRVAKRRDFVDPNTFLETTFSYVFENVFATNPFLVDPTGNGIDALRTTATTDFQSTVTVQGDNGALIGQKTVPRDGSAAKEIRLEYTDAQNPFKPTEVNEFFDGFERQTVRQYDGNGNLLLQKVFDENNKAAVTRMTWHPAYNLPTSQKQWQRLDETGNVVEAVLVYGQAEGTVHPTDDKLNKYLIQRKERLSNDPNDFAVTSMTWRANGQEKTRTSPVGNTTTTEYDANNYPLRVKVAGQTQQLFYHDVIGQRLLEMNALGGVRRQDFDGHGRGWRVRTYDDAACSLLDPNDFAPSRYDALTALSMENFGYDDRNNRTFEQKPDAGSTPGGIITTTYTTDNQPDVTTWFTYDDGMGDFVQTAQQDNTYNGRGLKIQETRTDAVTGRDWQVAFAYDDQGRSTDTTRTDYDDATILKAESQNYYGSGKVKTRQEFGPGSSLEKTTAFTYDIFDRLATQVTDPNGLNLTVTAGYDAVGNRTLIIDPKNNVIYTDYDNRNRKVAEYFAEASGTPKVNATVRKEIGYYDDGTISEITSFDYDGTTVLAHSTYAYDEHSRLKTVTKDIKQSPLTQAITTYEYATCGFADPNSEYVVKITDAENKETLRALDGLGRMTKILYPSGDFEEAEYNGDGSVVRQAVWDPNDVKRWIEFDYDGYGRQIRKTYPDNGTVEWTYDGFGRKLTVLDNRNSVDRIGGTGVYADTLAYDYDPLDRMVSKTDQDGYVVDYIYRGDGQKFRVGVHHADDPNTELYSAGYQYDVAGRLTFVLSPSEGFLDNWVSEFQYDANGNRDALTYYLNGNPIGGSTVQVDYHYNKDNLLLGYETTGGPTFSMDENETVVDGLGRLRYMEETITRLDDSTLNHNYTYDYDMLSQLTDAYITDVPPTDYREHQYVYDKAGNRIESTFDNGGGDTVSDWTYDGDLVTSKVSPGRTDVLDWDANGRQIRQLGLSGSSLPLEYDWDGRLRYGHFLNPSLGMEARYTPDGVRIYKKRNWNLGSYEHKFIVDEVGDFPTILLTLDPNDCCILKTYVHANGQVLIQFDGDNTADKYFYLHDRLGSVRALMDTSGDVVNCYFYTPFGSVTSQESQETVNNWYGFAGYYADEEVGQYHAFRRQYDPFLGRFTTRDPVIGVPEEPRTLHAYLYVLNDPVNDFDPTGEIALNIASGLILGTIVYALGYTIAIEGANRNDQVGDVLFDIGFFIINWITPVAITYGFANPIQVGKTALVTRWPGAGGGAGALSSGNFVQLGGKNILALLFSGKVGSATLKEGVEQVIEKTALKFPSGWEFIKGLIGQRVIR